MKINTTLLALSMLGICSAVQAQEKPTVSLGLRAWQTQWDTFSYAGGNIIQAPANEKTVLLPVMSVRWRDFTGSLSLYPSTDYDFFDGGQGSRKEFDANVGYFVTPSVALTLGYKKIEQRGSAGLYALGGPVLGVSGTAALGRDFSLYGSLGLGKMKSPGRSDIQFDADYRLSELGLAYTVPTASFIKAVTFTLGYRTQVLTSKEAQGSQDGRDLTQGFTLGALATF